MSSLSLWRRSTECSRFPESAISRTGTRFPAQKLRIGLLYAAEGTGSPMYPDVQRALLGFSEACWASLKEGVGVLNDWPSQPFNSPPSGRTFSGTGVYHSRFWGGALCEL